MDSTLFDLASFDPARDRLIADGGGFRAYEHVESGLTIRYSVGEDGLRSLISTAPAPRVCYDSIRIEENDRRHVLRDSLGVWSLAALR